MDNTSHPFLSLSISLNIRFPLYPFPLYLSMSKALKNKGAKKEPSTVSFKRALEMGVLMALKCPPDMDE